MKQKIFCLIAGIIFLLVSLLHLARLVFQGTVTVAGWEIPMWISIGGFIIAGYLAYEGFRHGKSV